MAKGLWTVTMAGGNMFLVRAARRASARAYAYRTYGSDRGPYKIERATQEDQDWFETWGGAIHET